jgi:hypothetical protein
MSSFTYEFENSDLKLETYEWDNTWIDNAPNKEIPRVLYIGDSISCATRRVATAKSDNKILFDGFGTSKAVDNPYLMPSVELFANQQGQRRAVLFNNGLHGWHLEDGGEYKAAYESVLNSLIKAFPKTPIVLLLTTHVSNVERDQRVVIRNKAVLELAEKYGLGTVDLYSIIKNDPTLIGTDGVHLTKDGYELLANEIVNKVKEILN